MIDKKRTPATRPAEPSASRGEVGNDPSSVRVDRRELIDELPDLFRVGQAEVELARDLNACETVRHDEVLEHLLREKFCEARASLAAFGLEAEESACRGSDHAADSYPAPAANGEVDEPIEQRMVVRNPAARNRVAIHREGHEKRDHNIHDDLLQIATQT